MGTFADAMHDFVTASVAYHELLQRQRTMGQQAASERTLAQAGDVLEREMRQVMREEVCRVVQESAIH